MINLSVDEDDQTVPGLLEAGTWPDGAYGKPGEEANTGNTIGAVRAFFASSVLFP